MIEGIAQISPLKLFPRKAPALLKTEVTDNPAAREKIRALDLEPIKFKLVKEQGWPLEKADRVEQLYKGYLLLFVLYPQGEHVPTRDIDEMWHSHILDTQKYMEDCQDIFGYYLHHYPYLGLLGEEDAKKAEEQFAATRRFFIASSGLDPVGQDAANCGGGCGGSSCGGSSCGGHSCGGHSCGGHSCSGGGGHSHSCSGGGSHDSGGSHSPGHGDTGGGHHTPASSCTAPAPVISSCSSPSSIPSTPLRDRWKKKEEKKKDKKPANDQKPPAPKKPSVWRRIGRIIHGASGRAQKPAPDAWQRSVTPARVRRKGRPTRADLLKLAAFHLPDDATRH